MRTSFTFFMLLSLLLLSSCKQASSPLSCEGEQENRAVLSSLGLCESGEYAIPHPSAWKTRLWENCLAVQRAVEEFAVQNDGVYPSNVDTDRTPSGNTVIDLLPCGKRLMNIFTMCRSEPVNCIAMSPGQTGYRALISKSGVCAGYHITGYGKHGIKFTILKMPESD